MEMWSHNCPVPAPDSMSAEMARAAGPGALRAGSVAGAVRSAPGSAERAVEPAGTAAPVAAAAAAALAAVATAAAVAARRTRCQSESPGRDSGRADPETRRGAPATRMDCCPVLESHMEKGPRDPAARD